MHDRLKQLVALPFHQYLGVTSVESQSGRGELSLKVSENIVNSAGMFHGGAIYALCDICAYGALFSLLDDTSQAVTHDIHVSVMRSARLGDFVCFNSEVVKIGKSLAFIDVKVTLEGQMIASARVTKSILSIRK